MGTHGAEPLLRENAERLKEVAVVFLLCPNMYLLGLKRDREYDAKLLKSFT